MSKARLRFSYETVTWTCSNPGQEMINTIRLVILGKNGAS